MRGVVQVCPNPSKVIKTLAMNTLLLTTFWIAAVGATILSAGPMQGSTQNSRRDPAMRQRDEQAAQETVSSNETIEKRGDLYMARKFYKEAAETYQKAIAADPKNPVSHNKLGIAYHQLLNYNSAVKSYRKAIQLRPQ